MGRERRKRGDVWWLAHGHSSRSRQPSFAPPTARPVVTHNTYKFGWHRTKHCFITSSQYGWVNHPSVEEYLCDFEVAEKMLRICAYNGIRKRFFEDPYTSDEKAGDFVARGHSFTIKLGRYLREFRLPAEATIYFDSPDGAPQRISLHHGMTRSFGRTIAGLLIDDIHVRMR